MAAFGTCNRHLLTFPKRVSFPEFILTDVDNRNTLANGDGIFTSSRVRKWIGKGQGRTKSTHYSGLLSQRPKLFSSYKTTVYDPGTPKVAIARSNTPYSHSRPRLLSSFPSTSRSARWPDNMDKWGSMGELLDRGRLLGDYALRRCVGQICCTCLGGDLCHTRNVLSEVLSVIFKWMDKREI